MVLGLPAILFGQGIPVAPAAISIDIPLMLATAAALLPLAFTGFVIRRWEGLLFVLLYTAYTLYLVLASLGFHTLMSIRLGRKEIVDPAAKPDTMPLNSKPVPLWLALLLLVAGIALLVAGAQLLVTGAVSIATALGVSSLVIGLTVVAVGTSLPELATSIIALLKGETDMAVGNIVGSNIFNIGMVLGLPAILFGQGIPVAPAAISIDIPLMLATAAALLPLAFTGFVIRRWEGLLFVLLYTAYTVYLVLASTQHDAAEGFSNIMLWFVLPLVAMTLVAVTSYEFGVLKERKAAKLAKPS